MQKNDIIRFYMWHLDLLDTWEYSAYGKVYCVYTYGSYLYVITGSSPPTVLKVAISDGTLSDYWVATNVLYKGISLFVMGSYLYVGGADSSDILRGKLVQLNLSTMEYVDSLLAPDSNDANWVSGITGDDSYIYFCLETLTTAEAGEYIVGKADPADMSLTDSYDVQELPIGNTCGNCHEICISGSYIYTANFTGHVLKLAKSDMSLSTYYYDSSKQFLSITTDGTYVYAGGKEGLPPPGKYIIDKFAISDLSLSVEWDAGYTYIYSLAYSDSKLYAASKKYCYVLDPSDMSLDGQWESANDDWSYLAVSNNRIYFGQEFTPATVYILGTAIVTGYKILKEDGDVLLKEDGDALTLEFGQWDLGIIQRVNTTDNLAKAIGLTKGDTFNITDALGKAYGAVKAEAFTIADSIIKAVSLNKADSVTLTDGLAKAIGAIKSDTLIIGDGIVKAYSKVRADTLAITDSILKAIGINKSDIVNIADVPIKAISLNKSDTLTIADALRKAISLVKADTLNIADICAPVIGAVTHLLSLFDTVTISDSLVGVLRIWTRLKISISPLGIKGMDISRMAIKKMNISKTTLYRWITRRWTA